MKCSFIFPSCGYNIVLNEKELKELNKKGYIKMIVSKTNCRTHRGIYNYESNMIETWDDKEIYNHLMFRTDEDVADISAGDHDVQYLYIVVGGEE